MYLDHIHLQMLLQLLPDLFQIFSFFLNSSLRITSAGHIGMYVGTIN